MTKAAMERGRQLQVEIERTDELIRKVAPYQKGLFKIFFRRGVTNFDESGELVCLFENNDTVLLALMQILKEHRDELQEEFESLKGNETEEKIENMLPVWFKERFMRKYKI